MASFTKKLAAVEVERNSSNQHEFHGISQLRNMLGNNRAEINALFSLRGEAETYPSVLTWYDARESHPDRSEHRLYFPTNPVMLRANAGDEMIFTLNNEEALLCELVKK